MRFGAMRSLEIACHADIPTSLNLVTEPIPVLPSHHLTNRIHRIHRTNRIESASHRMHTALDHNLTMQVVVPEEFRYLYAQNAERPVVKIPAAVLRQKAAVVKKVSAKTLKLVDELMRVMKLANGIGLAAPQLGHLNRVIVIAPDGMKPMALINPVVVKAEGEQVGQEGCLSIPGLYGDVKRAMFVEVEAVDRTGHEILLTMQGMPARVVQHEIDHLDGILFIDKVDPATLHWSHPEGEPQAE
jgi:peptide deformylase